MKMLYFNMSKLAKRPEEAKDDSHLKDFKKVFSQIYDETDLRSDAEKTKDPIYIWNNEAFIEEKKDIVGKVNQQRTKEEQFKMSQQMNTGLWYGDYYSPNDNFPYATSPN